MPSAGRPAIVAPVPPVASELPRGGRVVLPAYRALALSGTPQVPPLGELGSGTPDQAMQRLTQLASGFSQPAKPILPAFELVAVVASQSPGSDGKYRFRQPDGVVQGYLDAARRGHGLLIIDIQPGRSDFRSEIDAYRRYLEQPDVGLALEPALQRGATPQQSGSIDASEVNAISGLLADTVRRLNLPQKLLVVHESTPANVRGERALRQDPNVAIVLSADASGDQRTKLANYQSINASAGQLFSGLMVLSRQDINPLSATDLLRLRPAPDFVDYR